MHSRNYGSRSSALGSEKSVVFDPTWSVYGSYLFDTPGKKIQYQIRNQEARSGPCTRSQEYPRTKKDDFLPEGDPSVKN